MMMPGGLSGELHLLHELCMRSSIEDWEMIVREHQRSIDSARDVAIDAQMHRSVCCPTRRYLLHYVWGWGVGRWVLYATT